MSESPAHMTEGGWIMNLYEPGMDCLLWECNAGEPRARARHTDGHRSDHLQLLGQSHADHLKSHVPNQSGRLAVTLQWLGEDSVIFDKGLTNTVPMFAAVGNGNSTHAEPDGDVAGMSVYRASQGIYYCTIFVLSSCIHHIAPSLTLCGCSCSLSGGFCFTLITIR